MPYKFPQKEAQAIFGEIARAPKHVFAANIVKRMCGNDELLCTRGSTYLLYLVVFEQTVDEILADAELECIPTQVFVQQTSYLEFLERVHATELLLRSLGLWEVPHPWINLLVPASKMGDFERTVFRNLDASTLNGPVIVYPFNRNM